MQGEFYPQRLGRPFHRLLDGPEAHRRCPLPQARQLLRVPGPPARPGAAPLMPQELRQTALAVPGQPLPHRAGGGHHDGGRLAAPPPLPQQIEGLQAAGQVEVPRRPVPGQQLLGRLMPLQRQPPSCQRPHPHKPNDQGQHARPNYELPVGSRDAPLPRGPEGRPGPHPRAAGGLQDPAPACRLARHRRLRLLGQAEGRGARWRKTPC